VIVFAGTTEGYEVSRHLAQHKVPVYVSVATDYGKKSLTKSEFLHVEAARLDAGEMKALFERIQPELILDATHPYAAEVTKNIRLAAEQTGYPYVRILRKESASEGEAVYVDSTEDAAEFLKGTTGNILLTTGSKELKKFTVLPDYQNRLFARVLSLPSVMNACAELGLEGRHLIGMQGPFSRELNTAMLRQYDCKYLVTKDSGTAGGFKEKLDAARECKAVSVVIGRPLKEEGLSLEECEIMLAGRFGYDRLASAHEAEVSRAAKSNDKTESESGTETETSQKITLLGIGMGSEGTLTVEGRAAVQAADLIIGARRMADAVARPGQAVHYEYRSEEIASYIKMHPEYRRIVIALSGDVGFYSGARKLIDRLEGQVEILCGISSVVYFMAKIGLSWDDAKILSAHGRSCNLVAHIAANEKVFAILGTPDGAANLAQKLTDYGMGEVLLYIGENLSYPNENILCKKACELTDYKGDALSVVCAVNPKAAKPYTTHGVPDGAFLRGKAPMTKEEVRSVSLSKLRLHADSICYDVGAGTGSVSIEMAQRCIDGAVYAIEKKEDAVELLKENKRRFAVDNLHIVPGTAPEALTDLPVPSHAFIGGSSGNLKEICALLLEKNPAVRIVINCITLETVSEALAVLKSFPFSETEIVQMSVSRSKEVGRYHMMMGENPIYVITAQGGERHADS
jgi:precorrin-6Y C5,15-methyltransferase (decarboxylating)